MNNDIQSKKILDVNIPLETKATILEKIKKYIQYPSGFFHIVSINPEILVIAYKNQQFKKIINTAQIKLIDGIGIVLAGKIFNVELGERITGTELMQQLVILANKLSLRVLLIGGRPNLAVSLSNCYQKSYSQANFYGTIGIKNIKDPQESEENDIFSIVGRFKPHIILSSFGSPDQEKWLWDHQQKLKGIICLGVGGAFDFWGGAVPRAPIFLQKIGFEWLFRLFVQPWRWRRQLRLIRFLWLVTKEKLRK